MQEQYEDKSELKNESDEVRRWLDEIDLALKSEKDWRRNGEKVWKVYRSESDADTKKDTFNILWANVEIKRQSIINSVPIPDIRRRYGDDDPVGLNVCELLNRAVTYTLDCQEGLHKLIQCANDFLVPSRGQIRVRYKGYQSEDLEPQEEEEDGEGAEEPLEQEEQAEPEHEECVIEHVNWAGWTHGPGKTWDEVRWEVFIHEDVTKEDAIRQFGKEKAEKLQYNKKPESGKKDDHDSDKSIFARTTLYELWDKDERKVRWLAKDYDKEYLDVVDDPLNLKNFFSTPRPCYAVEDPNSLIPIIEYGQYETLAKELEDITRRILRIVRACKVRGVYDGRISEIERVLNEDDNALIAAANASTLTEIGGLDKAVWFMPIEQLVGTVQVLQQQRMAVKGMIDELNGMSDIVRGSTNANETATAQRIKANFAAARLDKQKQAFQIFARDLIRLIVEVVSGFSRETLSRMTGLRFITEQEKQAAVMQLQALQQQVQMLQGQQLPPGQAPQMQQQIEQQMQQAQQITTQITWEQIEEVLRSDMEREYRIDIETDSTMAADQQAEQEVLASFMQAMAQFSTMASNAVQAGLMAPEAAKAIMLSFTRKFRLGKEVEEQLEKPLPPKGPDPEQQKLQAEMQMRQQEHQLEMTAKQKEYEYKEKEHQMKLAELRAQLDFQRQELALKQQNLALDQQAAQMKTAQTMQQTQLKGQYEDKKHTRDMERLDRKEVESASA